MSPPKEVGLFFALCLGESGPATCLTRRHRRARLVVVNRMLGMDLVDTMQMRHLRCKTPELVPPAAPEISASKGWNRNIVLVLNLVAACFASARARV